MRIIVANEPRAYRDVIVQAFQRLRPDAMVQSVEPGDLEIEIVDRRPHLVVCSRLCPRVLFGPISWVLLYPEYGRGSEISVAGRRSLVPEADFDLLLSIVDQTQQRVP